MPVLFVLFIVVPIIELFVLIQVGQVIGALPTVGLLVLMSVLGAWLVRREGTRAWSRFRGTMEAGRLPTFEVVDGALVVLGGALMVTPGFLTDVLGLLLVLPPTRALVNRAVRSRTRVFLGVPGASPRSRRAADRSDWARGREAGRGGGRTRAPRPDADAREATIDVEVVDVQRTPREDGPGRGGAIEG